MTSSARRRFTPIAIMFSLALAGMLFLTAGAGQAEAADSYTLESFTGCSEGLESSYTAASGSWDDAGNLYIACSSADGKTSTVKIYNRDGNPTSSVPLDFVASDVAPSPDSNYLYVTGQSEPVRFVKQNGSYSKDTSWKLDPYNSPVTGQAVRPHGFHITTDGAVGGGNIYLSDGGFAGGTRGETNTVIKYKADGTFVARFGQADTRWDAGKWTYVTQPTWENGKFYSLLTGLAVSRDGEKVYTTENGNNRVQRWNKQVDNSYKFHSKFGGSTDTDRSGGDCNYANPSVPWKGTFAAPYDVGIDEASNVYVLNTTCRSVQKFVDNNDGTYKLVFTSEQFRNADNSSWAAKPHGFAVAQSGSVYIGNSGKKLTGSDTKAPTVTSTTPQTGATSVAVSADVTATFSEAMNASTISGTTFTLKKVGAATAVPASVTYDATNKRATLNPTANLEAGVQYTATLSGAKDVAGNALPVKTWSFTMANAAVETSCTVKDLNGDLINGGTGSDTLKGTANSDGFCGFAGDDTITGEGGDDRMDGGEGSDTVSFTTALAGVAVHLSYNGNDSWTDAFDATDDNVDQAGIGYDNPLTEIENITGSLYADSLYGADNANIITGEGGADKIYAYAGDDTIYATDGVADTIDCGGGSLDKVFADATDVVQNCETIEIDTNAPPTITSVKPTSGQTSGVLRNANVTATFSEEMNSGTLTTADTLASSTSAVNLYQKHWYQVRKKKGKKIRRVWTYRWVEVSASVGCDTPCKTAELDPYYDLAANTDYWAIVTTGAKDKSGNALAENYSWTFTTGST